MKVVTLDEGAFRDACRRLWTAATAASSPDILVGIRTGGFVVAEAMIAAAAHDCPLLLPITRRRASTARKSGNAWIGKLLRRLPYSVTDRIRLLEHRAIAGRRARRKAAATPDKLWEPDAAEAGALADAIRARPGARVLVVDDAVDTGTTLRAVRALILSIDPRADVRSAVLVTTTDAPIAKPDMSLFNDVLCRFPWSHDFVR